MKRSSATVPRKNPFSQMSSRLAAGDARRLGRFGGMGPGPVRGRGFGGGAVPPQGARPASEPGEDETVDAEEFVARVLVAAMASRLSKTVQPEGAVTGMRIAYILVPTLGALLAIWVMREYDVTEEKAKEIRAELERRRGKTLLA